VIAAAARDEGARILAAFRAAGAVPVETPILQPADTLLDLYGEDIRARAYVTQDPLRGEMMLRPDFTVPVVQMHMAEGRDPARYCYLGEVFRRQETDPTRPTEFLQVGYEVFGGDPAQADAEVYAVVREALGGLPVSAAFGDLGLIRAAVEGLETTPERRAALMRHLWRPRRFRALLDAFSHPVGPRDLPPGGPEIGRRGAAEVAEGLAALARERSAPPLPATAVALLERLLSLSGPAPEVLDRLLSLQAEAPAMARAVVRFADRLAALAARGVDPAELIFEGSFGRTTLEYYDGFVFGLTGADGPGLPPVASGGRYDALTAVLGGGQPVPAVGAIIRPERVLAIRGAA
jgi:ATP phosphoribosyltransferase regulatory subunit